MHSGTPDGHIPTRTFGSDVTPSPEIRPALPDRALRAALDALPHPVLIVDRSLRVAWANAVAHADLGGRDAVGRELGRLAAERSADVLASVAHRAWEGAAPESLRADVVAGSPSRRWLAHCRRVDEALVVLTMTPLSSSPVDALLPGEPGPAFRHMADVAPVMIWLADADGVCHWFNAQWLTFRGRNMEQERGDGWAEGVHADDRGRVLSAYRRALTDRQPFELEYRLLRHDGEWRWIIDHGVPRFDAQSRFVGFVGSCIDVTERRRLEEDLRHAHKLEAVGRVVGTIAHDFNNLLTVVLGQAELIRCELGAVPETARAALGESVADLVEAVERARVLTQRLLAFGRRRQVVRESLDLCDWLRRFGNILRRLVREDVEIEHRLAAQLPRIELDRAQLEQILLNLAVNASDAMPAGGRMTIEVAAEPGEDGRPGVRLSVTDTGIGIAPEIQARIFEPFFTTKADGVGVGIGLATVRDVVAALDGSIRVRSRPGDGTTFDVWFPAEPSAAERVAPAREVAPSAPCRPLRVLVCEDEPLVRSVVETTLRSAGHEVVVAARPSEILARLDAGAIGAIDALVTDVVLPEMRGTELARQVRARLGTVPIVLVSGYAGETEPESASCSNFTCFLHKPFSRDELLATLARCAECPARPPVPPAAPPR
ncbi:MAG: PAS domain-containing protein [Planctomycetes bacterium]|nr:PAS domain-containing protein [Planctomycetota bacterium]